MPDDRIDPPTLTVAEARALGLLDAPPTRTRPRTTRRTAPGSYWSCCHTCSQTFRSQAAETRHVDQVHGGRFDVFPIPPVTDE